MKNKKAKKIENARKRNLWAINPVTRKTKTKKEKLDNLLKKHKKEEEY